MPPERDDASPSPDDASKPFPPGAFAGVHLHDQASGTLTSLAQLLAGFWTTLVSRGVPTNDALFLTAELLRRLVPEAKPSAGGGQ